MIPVGFHSKNEYGHVKEFAHNIDQMYISHIIKKTNETILLYWGLFT